MKAQNNKLANVAGSVWLCLFIDSTFKDDYCDGHITHDKHRQNTSRNKDI